MNIQKTILGIMSGTSLDGLDLALCTFTKRHNRFSFDILKTDFFAYDEIWKKYLSTAQNLNSFDFIKLHKRYGKFIGQIANTFLQGTKAPDFIASHGHTIFHEPKQQITFQIGDGAFIAAETGIPVISDFRNLDTAYGGQGAPLVPIGDKLLFPEFDYCLNLGGFANISDKKNEKAYDICPFNFIINDLTRKINKEFDKNGEIGRRGAVNSKLLNELDNIEYYNEKAPKSLGREYAEKHFYPLFDQYKISLEDFIRTYYEHSANQINRSILKRKNQKILITGGGAHNKFFISLLRKFPENKWIVPDNSTIDYKEAIIFAFLGFLRSIEEINTSASVTGARKNTSGAAVFLS
jgi:anhydro-N-acetylmuramic acid kinase